ncbi:MAG: hypothetical protein O3A81_04825 [bacterium]|nr:hypothetical protein [bacterium]
MRADSLKALGGDERKFEIKDPTLRAKVVQFLENIPYSNAANVALNEASALFPALQYLANKNLLTTVQYDLLAIAIADSHLETALPKTAILRAIFSSMSLERTRIYDAIGWNQYPTDKDQTIDVTI